MEEEKLKKNTLYGNALGTSYSINFLSKETVDYAVAIDSIFEVVNQSMSTYQKDSDISKINKGDTTVVVDHMFEEVYNLSRKVHQLTNGKFDPTVGALVNAWGFGPGKQISLDSSKVDSLLKYVGFDKVLLTPKKTIKKASEYVHFDFNAVAKGYSIDRIAAFFDQQKVDNYLIEVGGELIAKGENKISGKLWTVGIDDPDQGLDRTYSAVVNLKNKAMASSGNYRKFRIDPTTGKKFVHTIDPKSGFTKASNILGTTVVADYCAYADALATSFMVMSFDETLAFLKEHEDIDVFIVYADTDGTINKFMTEGFEKMLVAENK
ncbi:MAG: FAD:protein FMN transferase [Flavobacteriaceae bacterium]|nr:FAD:protein FMN transferase [Flavobacteriaceae bacterium]